MNKTYLFVAVLCMPLLSIAQDEGSLVKKERIDLDKGIFIGAGPSFTLGENIGDYSTGFNIEAGFLKRVNRVFSIGPSISYISFKYDPQETGDNNVFLDFQNEYYNANYDLYYRPGMYVDFSGGDLSLLSIAFNLKLNFIPIRDDSKISLYAFAKPFISFSKRTEVKGDSYIFNAYDINDDEVYTEEEIVTSIESEGIVAEIPWVAGDPTWESIGVTISDDLKEDSRVTGGIFIGPGIEILPTKNVSFFAQVAIGYTFPVSFISTENYDENDLNEVSESYPIIEEGFPSINLQFGISFNF